MTACGAHLSHTGLRRLRFYNMSAGDVVHCNNTRPAACSRQTANDIPFRCLDRPMKYRLRSTIVARLLRHATGTRATFSRRGFGARAPCLRTPAAMRKPAPSPTCSVKVTCHASSVTCHPYRKRNTINSPELGDRKTVGFGNRFGMRS